MKSGTVAAAKAPPWAMAPFETFLSDMDRLRQMVDISCRGIAALRGMPRIVETLINLDQAQADQARQKALLRAQAEARLAEQEVQQGFPVLHAWATTSLWGQLEALIKTIVAEWLRHKRDVWNADEVKKIKIRVGDYEALRPSERYLFLSELLEKERGVGVKNGVARFEESLKVLNLSGEVPEVLRKVIFEFGQVRNLLVHRSGRVDQNFKRSCPWLKVQIGKEFVVTRSLWSQYNHAVNVYITLMIARVGEQFGVNMASTRQYVSEGVLKLSSPNPNKKLARNSRASAKVRKETRRS